MPGKAVAKDLKNTSSPGPSSAVLFLLKEVTVDLSVTIILRLCKYAWYLTGAQQVKM